MASNLEGPKLKGTMRESAAYRTLNAGLTDRLFLLGHADGLSLNDPFPVVDVQAAINKLQANTDSPLLRALFEAYYSGAKDIWLVATAPMSEYDPTVTTRNTVQSVLGNKTFYQKYKERLDTTYALLLEWEHPQIIVPVEASFYNAGGVDFLTQLSNHCSQGFINTGCIRVGILGTRGALDSSSVSTLANDARLKTQGSAGKFVMVAVGEGLVNNKEMPIAYSTSVAVSAAAELSRLPLNRGLTYRVLSNIVRPSQSLFTADEREKLALAKLNPLVQTAVGRRGAIFQTALFTDNTLGEDGSDFWSLVQVRLVSRVNDKIRNLGRQHIGNATFAEFKQQVEEYLFGLASNDLLREFTVDIRRSPEERTKVLVDVSLLPYFGVRSLSFSIEVGPSETP